MAAKIWEQDAKWGNGGGKQFEVLDWNNLPIKKIPRYRAIASLVLTDI